tara:strand:- start:2022 stop:2294 length:273 start_codon:yes stop_codon:yes gene_type:complete
MVNKFDANAIIQFYDDMEKFASQNKNIPNEIKVVTLFRVALELASEKLGLVEAAYLMARLQHTTLGLALGKDESFDGILKEVMEKKPTIN